MKLNVIPPIVERRLRACSGWRAIGPGLIAAIAGAACITPAVAAPERIPPLVEPRGQEHHVGKVIFEELVTPDLAASKLFYAGMFGWSFRDFQAGGTHYTAASLDGRPVAGLVQKLASENYARASANMLPATAVATHPHWINYVRVDDVAKMVDKAVALGAHVMVGTRLDRHGGHVAIVADPQGAAFGMLEWTTNDDQKVAK